MNAKALHHCMKSNKFFGVGKVNEPVQRLNQTRRSHALRMRQHSGLMSLQWKTFQDPGGNMQGCNMQKLSL